jgi:predicted MFS family arabinose efflux permease
VFYLLLARDLQLSTGVIGLIASTSAIGGLIGSLVAARFAAKVGQGPAIWISAAAAIQPVGRAAFALRVK